jgi:thiol-disulfide isomerase/thioredoxin
MYRNFLTIILAKRSWNLLIPCWSIFGHPGVGLVVSFRRSSMSWPKVNIDESQGIAQQFGISSIPTLMVFKGGEPVETLVGMNPKSRIQEVLDAAK